MTCPTPYCWPAILGMRSPRIAFARPAAPTAVYEPHLQTHAPVPEQLLHEVLELPARRLVHEQHLDLVVHDADPRLLGIIPRLRLVRARLDRCDKVKLPLPLRRDLHLHRLPV